MAIAKAPVVSSIWDTERESLFSSESYFSYLLRCPGNSTMTQSAMDAPIWFTLALRLVLQDLELAQRALR
ncbi:MAG TPA: hypothetical protein VFP59_17830 [Candidatus Angelobacter sp.]|nr:hypothetical protein [Candidatus Angelobacter sp.]